MRRTRIDIVIATMGAALAASLIASSSALAGSWFVNEAKLAKGAMVAVANTAAVDTSAALNVPSLGIKVTCSGAVGEAKKPYIQGETTGGAEAVVVSGCSELAPTTCTIQSTIETEPVTGSVETASGSADIVRIVPKTGKTFATILFRGTCAESGEQPVIGQFAFQCPDGQIEWVISICIGVGNADGNNSLELFKGKGYIESGKALLKLVSGQLWSFH